MRWLACSLLPLSLVAAQAQEGGDPWARGRIRELFISGLPADEAALASWAADGANGVTGIKPELAHAHGLLTRSWFTMNYMDSRNMDEATLRSMSAVREDGTPLRPFDPLFPTVGQYGWTACVNNPRWIAHSQGLFRKMAQDGYDGAHIDFASHYEPCACEHCAAAWSAYAKTVGLGEVAFRDALHASERPTQMRVREFRIRSVMSFLNGLREAGRAVVPHFGIDGTWHHDSGSTYQWAYGEHFDLMCIEGTTHGPFPPAGSQLGWLKLSHALSERPAREGQPARRPAAMSVTYHLLPDEQGVIHHGRMAPDRVRVALAEIVSQGAVSWLGLGGPKTGSLIREHQDIVRANLRLARELEPLLTAPQEVAEIGIVFSARSYLIASGAYTQMHALTQALMRGHVPFRLVSDVGLSAEALRGLPGVVVLSAPALTDEGCAAVEQYVQQGGRALLFDTETATIDEDWRDRADRPSFAVAPEGADGVVQVDRGRGQVVFWAKGAGQDEALGASQLVTLNHDQPYKLAIEGWSKAERVNGRPDGNYALYVDLHHQDGAPMWGQTAIFDVGTHDWQFRRTIITSDKPFKTANVHLLFRGHQGTVWFRDVKFGVWDEANQRIVENLLGSTYNLPDGSTRRPPGEAAGRGAWSPYGEGYSIDDHLDEGWWVKMDAAGEGNLLIGDMHQPDPATVARALEVLAPLRAAQPYVTLTGEGAEQVSVDVTRTGDRLAVHLINYRAELHPERPELEQQQTERSLPAANLVLTLHPPQMTLDPASVRVRAPETAPNATHEAAGDGVTVRLDQLGTYAVVLVDGRAR